MNIYGFHELNNMDDKKSFNSILNTVIELYKKINDFLPENSEKETALDKLLETLMWSKFSLTKERGIIDELQAETKRPPDPIR